MVITTLLDNDFYQYTMGSYAYTFHPEWEVTYRFRNRTFEVPLAECLDLAVLTTELEALFDLRLSTDERVELERLDLFSEDYLQALADWSNAPGMRFALGQRNGHLELTYTGPWWIAVLYETPVLAIINEMYFSRFAASTVEGERRLAAKCAYLAENPQLHFVEFGSRRRFSSEWQAHVMDELWKNCSGLLGTSNVALARDYGMTPRGTMAHQLFMVETAKTLAQSESDDASDQAMVDGQWNVIDHWHALYDGHHDMMTALPDTYSSAQFFSTFTKKELDGFYAMRQDSGDPIKFGELYLGYLRRFGLNPVHHGLMFSDSLNLRSMSLLHDTFAARIPTMFGWGTNLTNDLGFETLSTVIKPESVDGLDCVKLSDDLRKATGDPQAIARYQAMLTHA